MGTKTHTAVIGVDEAGRGPLAGPVAVGTVLFAPDFRWGLLDGVRDSKQHTERQREEWFSKIQEWEEKGWLRCVVSLSSAQTIDRRGISRATLSAVARGVKKLAPDPCGIHIQLDGLLKAPQEYGQETIIHGDALMPSISLASIAAKVTRDRFMLRMAKRFPQYGFERHKGYGTREHARAIEKHGLCELHRESFCRSFLSPGV